MTRFNFEFPTEWSLCPDVPPDERKQPVSEAKANEQDVKAAETQSEPRVLTAGGSEPSW